MFLFVVILFAVGAFTGMFSEFFATQPALQVDDQSTTTPTSQSPQNIEEKPPGERAQSAPSGTLFLDKNSYAASVINSHSNPNIATLLQPIAKTPSGIWQTSTSDIATFESKIQTARSMREIPIVVLYNIPNIGCGNQGAPSLDAYKAWIDERTPVLNDSSAIIIIEPDAVPFFDCLSNAQLQTRIAALNYAVDKMVSTGSTVYIDAGHSKWVSAAVMAERLRESGVARTRGISVNVSNYQTNESSTVYAQDVLNAIGLPNLGAVIDTSRNGNGPAADLQWCNARGMRLGTPSQLLNNAGVIDAYLWIKVPGESDGTGPNCSNSPVAEGEFWLEYALELL